LPARSFLSKPPKRAVSRTLLALGYSRSIHTFALRSTYLLLLFRSHSWCQIPPQCPSSRHHCALLHCQPRALPPEPLELPRPPHDTSSHHHQAQDGHHHHQPSLHYFLELLPSTDFVRSSSIYHSYHLSLDYLASLSRCDLRQHFDLPLRNARPSLRSPPRVPSPTPPGDKAPATQRPTQHLITSLQETFLLALFPSYQIHL
jgi:hypothetical protein